MTTYHTVTAKLLFLVALLFAGGHAMALELDDAKARGLVGEQPDGYLGVVQDTAEVRTLVTDINAKRRAEYQRIATANNVGLADVEKLAGGKAIEKTAAGNYVRGADGAWRKK